MMGCVIKCIILTVSCGLAMCLYSGDICLDARTNQTGMCKDVTTCKSARETLENRLKPTTCGFVGFIPIVCCLDNETSTLNLLVGRMKPTTVGHGTTTPNAHKFDTTLASVADNGLESVKRIISDACKHYGSLVFVNVSSIIPNMSVSLVDTCTINVIPIIPSVNRKDFPYLALLGYEHNNNKVWKCAGTLISEEYILTSAYCTKLEYGYVKFVRLGFDKMDKYDMQEIQVLEIIKHPHYIEGTHYCDIALLKLLRPAILSPHIRPACLPTGTKFNTQNVIVSGWNMSTLDLNKNVQVRLDYPNCTREHSANNGLISGVVENLMFCLKPTREASINNLGGGVVIYNQDVYCTYAVVGVLSSDNGSPFPTIVTNVSGYLTWIAENVWS